MVIEWSLLGGEGGAHEEVGVLAVGELVEEDFGLLGLSQVVLAGGVHSPLVQKLSVDVASVSIVRYARFKDWQNFLARHGFPVDAFEEGVLFDFLSIECSSPESLVWVSLQQSPYEALQLGRSRRNLRKVNSFCCDSIEQLHFIEILEGRLAGVHFEDQSSETPPVDCAAMPLSPDDLWG